jgi:DNA-binding XRE family transcriptional regulator
MSLQNLKNKAFQNKEVHIEYKKLDSEFDLIDALLTVRKQSGLTQEEVAQKMGTKKSNVSRLEKSGANPSWNTLQNYAHACGYELVMKFKHSLR